MPASDDKINDLIDSINSRADAGNDEAQLAFGTPGSSITDPVLNGMTVDGTFDTGEGIKDDGGSSAIKSLVEGIADHLVEDGITAGAVVMYAGTTTPTGWLLCDGAAVSRTTFSALFGVIGTTFGVGDGSTTFNLPDFAARFPRGTTGTPGTTGGSDTNSHTHTAGGAAGNISLGGLASIGVPSDDENRPAFLEMRFIIKT